MAIVKVESADSVAASPGEDVTLEVPGGGTTGHMWQITTDPAAVAILDHKVVADEASFGGAGVERFTVRPLREGEATIRFELKAPWDLQPAETLSLRMDSRRQAAS